MFQAIKANSLKKRIIAISILMLVFIMSLTAGTIYWSFQKSLQKNIAQNLEAFLDLLIASTEVVNGQVILTETDSLANIPRYWQIKTKDKILYKSDLMLEKIPFNGKKEVKIYKDLLGTEILATTETIIFPGDIKVDYFFGMPNAIAERLILEQKNEFFTILVLVLAFLSVFLLIFIILQIKFLTKPLDRIKLELTNVTSGEKKRLAEDFPNEINSLVIEINKLISYIESNVERHKTFAGNLSHSLKTPISVILNLCGKQKSDFANLVKEKCQIISNIIERNLVRIKSSGKAGLLYNKTEISDSIERIAKTFSALYGKQYELDFPKKGLMADIEKSDFYEMAGNVIENACKYSKSKIKISIKNHSHLEIIIEDDGTGIAPEKFDSVLARGVRLDEEIEGNGVGLAISKDIAELYDGEIKLFKSKDLGGLGVIFKLKKTSSQN